MTTCGRRSRPSSGGTRTAPSGGVSPASSGPGGRRRRPSSAGRISGSGSACSTWSSSAGSPSAWPFSTAPPFAPTRRRLAPTKGEPTASSATAVRRLAARGAATAQGLRDCGWPWSRRRLRAGAGPGPRTADGAGAAGLPARRAGMGGRRPRPCLRHLPRPDLEPRRPTGHPAKVHRRAGRLPALDLRQPPLGREPLGATEGVAGDRNPLRENRQVLPRRPLLRRHLRLAQGLTGLNLFLHYAFDLWLARSFPAIPFERYADDIICHCRSEEEARTLWSALEVRFRTCGLVLHPTKTKLVYCKDANRRGDYPVQSFDFLGYTFRPRKAAWRGGRYGTSFLPAASPDALKAIRQTIRRWAFHHRTDKSLEDLARMYRPYIQGWINYYSHFYKSELTSTGVDLDFASDRCLPDPLGAQQVQATASAAQRCKRLAGAGHPRPPASVCALALSAWEWPNIGSRMTRECHVRFWERVGVRLPRATRQVAVKIAGHKHWLWRAVDQDGVVLDVLVQSRRDKQAAKRLLRKLLKKQMRPPRVMVTDKLASYGAAKKEIMPGVEHRQHKG